MSKYKVVISIFLLFFMGLASCSKTNYHSIVFESNGGNNLESVTFSEDSTINLPNDPIREGYLFIDWYTDNNTFSNVFSEDYFTNNHSVKILTLYAKWEIITYQINYQLNGGTNHVDNPTEYTIEDQPLILKDAEKLGFIFMGWFTDSNCTIGFNFEPMIYEDLTLYAKWMPVVYDFGYQLSTLNVSNLNPHNATDPNAEELYQLVTDSLYEFDYDWVAAKEILLVEGVMGLPETITFDEWYSAGHSSSDLPYNCYPAMASSIPLSIDEEGLVWRITLRQDLVFEDGTTIDANAFEYSWKMLLDPQLKNSNAVDLYQDLALRNAEEYFLQTTNAILFGEVGFEVIDTYTFEITLNTPKTAWDIMNALTVNSTGVVHQAQYEAGMNENRTYTTYGTIDNLLISYGPYVLSDWESNEMYYYTSNEKYYDVNRYRVKEIQYNVYESQTVIVEDFKDGLLDMIQITGENYYDFQYSNNLFLSPTSALFRLVLNVGGSDEYSINPMLSRVEFRKALFLAMDRKEITSDFRKFTLPTIGLLGPVYYATPYSPIPYRSTVLGIEVLSGFSPNQYGYEPDLAKELFDQAYADAVLSGDIQDGDIIHLEYKYYDVETSQLFEHWLKSTLEEIFNAGEQSDIFQLDLVGVSSSALNQAKENGNFEMIFSGWQGVTFDAPYFLGQVYNSSSEYMVEKGFDTENTIISVDLPYSKIALLKWIDAYLEIENPTMEQTEEYNKWVILYDRFIGDNLTVTYDELSKIAYEELWNNYDQNYTGKTLDFDHITAVMEHSLLDQMISIPLFTGTRVFVSGPNVMYEANGFHPIIEFCDLRYTDVVNHSGIQNN